jgi:hypothetical protein
VTPEEREELLAAYALGTLPGAEATQVEELVRSDRAAGEALAGYFEVVDLLSLATPLRRADPRLRGQVMDVARRESRKRAAAPRRAQVVPWFGAAAAALLLFAWGVNLQRGIVRLERENDALTAVVESDAKRLDALAVASSADGAGLRTQLAAAIADQQVALAVTADPEATSSELNPTPAGHGAGGRYVWSDSTSAGLLVARALPPLPIGSVYQVWLERGTTSISAGTFTPDLNGDAELVLRPEASIAPTNVLVAVAPQGGSADIGRPVVLVGSLWPGPSEPPPLDP